MNKEDRKQLVFIAHYLSQGSLISSRETHLMRNEFNVFPSSLVLESNTFSIQGKRFDKVFSDVESGMEWVKMPWHLSIFHQPWKNYKFVSFDSNIVPGSPGSAELITPKKSIIEGKVNLAESKPGSYNFKHSGFGHFLSDVLPTLIYCKCIGN
jgi:hypothetical protein